MADAQKSYELTLPTDTIIKVTKTFDCPKELVWKIYTDKEMILKWWGNADGKTIIEQQDLEVGGKWRYTQKDGGDMGAFYGEYKIVDKPNVLSYTFIWGGMPDKSMTETITLEERDGKTYMLDISEFPTKEERDGMIQTGMEEGMAFGFSKMDEIVAASK